MFLAGSDPLKYFYPSRYYLYDTLKNGSFPFWTERILTGFPIYADSERGYLNPLNTISVLMFGPFTSYKILHFAFYLLGSVSFYMFLKRKGANLLGTFAATVIYFFSFFHLYHAQHFNFELTTFSFPLALLFVDVFLEKSQLRQLIYLAILIALLIYFGSFQSVVLVFGGSILYLLVSVSKLPLRKKLYTIGVSLFLIFALTAPQIIPTLQLYAQSTRVLHGISYHEGSFLPVMLVNAVYPYLFGTGADYKWNQVSDEYYIHETYVYIGIVAIILALFGFTKLKDKNLKRYLIVLFFGSLVLGSIAYIPGVNLLKPPVLSMFRYWGRAYIYLVFVVACSVAFFFSKTTWKPAFKSYTYGFIGVFAFQLLGLLDKKTYTSIKLMVHGALKFDTVFLVWLGLIITTVLLLFLLYRGFYRVNYVLVILLVFDLYFFGKPVTNDYVRDLNYLYPKNQAEIFKNYENERIVYLDRYGFWNLPLYYKSWGIFGYTQYLSQNYNDYFKAHGESDTESMDRINVKLFDDLGVENPIINEFDGNLITETRHEGSFTLLLDSRADQIIYTKVKNYPGWELKINGVKSAFLNSRTDLFLNFPLAPGTYEVTLRFIPKAFYAGLAVSVTMLLAFCVAARYVKINP